MVWDKRLGSSTLTLSLFEYEVTYCEVSPSQVSVHCCHLREVALFYMCRAGPGSRSFSHHLNQSEVLMRSCHIRAYAGYLISLVNCHCTTQVQESDETGLFTVAEM